MGKCRSICFFFTLFVPGFCTIALLVFSILTNKWLRIRPEELDAFRNRSLEEFESYKLNVDNGQKNIDYLFIEKQWPFIKHKGLYSSCTRYEPLYLKISMSFLMNAKKSTIKAAKIHYPKYIIDSHEKLKDTKNCNQSDFVYCHATEECVEGKLCDGKSDCLDQTDEQFCEETQCEAESDNIRFNCDGKCWQSSQIRPGRQPKLCLNHSDEEKLWEKKRKLINLSIYSTDSVVKLDQDDEISLYKLGQDTYIKEKDCYEEYFDFKASKLIDSDELRALTQELADNIQDEYSMEYYLHLVFVISFLLATLFSLISLLTLFFLICFRKLCLQCPYWFFGLFTILTLLSCICGLGAFVYSYHAMYHKLQDPLRQLQLTSEIYRLNPQLKQTQTFCTSFGAALLATLICLLTTFLSFIVCCRLPSNRHEDKDYRVIQFN